VSAHLAISAKIFNVEEVLKPKFVFPLFRPSSHPLTYLVRNASLFEDLAHAKPLRFLPWQPRRASSNAKHTSVDGHIVVIVISSAVVV